MAYPLLLYVGFLVRRDRWQFFYGASDMLFLGALLAIYWVAWVLHRYQAARWVEPV
jgi:hypothetical protein